MKNFKQLIVSFQKLFFRNTCVSCDSRLEDEEIHICHNCLKELKYKSSIKEIKKGYYYIWDYNGKIKKIIKEYKYKNKKNIKKEINSIIKEKLWKIFEKENINCIIPIPISRERKNKRGFNQVEEILNDAKIKYTKIKRKKNIKPMYRIKNNKKREKNIKNSFTISKKINLNAKNILIFDDIITTGSTTNEMISEIKKNYEPNKIIVFVMALGIYGKHNFSTFY